jgi:hypothetical protein
MKNKLDMVTAAKRREEGKGTPGRVSVNQTATYIDECGEISKEDFAS